MNDKKKKTDQEDGVYYLDDTVSEDIGEIEKRAEDDLSQEEKAQEPEEPVAEPDEEKPEIKEAQPDLELELEKARNDFLYLRAEFDNYKKQAIKERAQLMKYGIQSFAMNIVDINDNISRALESEVTAESLKQFVDGIKMIQKDLQESLKRHGIEELNCLGEKFDPTLHEALSSEETDKFDPGMISQVFKTAYKLHDRILRPAQVVVAQAPKEDSGDK
jgi:molecular chaperone GrpE